jgi:hypothetical protein
VCSEHPAWKRLISHTLVAHEQISLITTIFSDRNQVNMVGHLSGGDAQTFIDTIDEVSPHKIPRPKDQSIDFGSNIHILSIRRWIASRHRSAGGVCTIYTIFVAAKPCFRDHWKSHFVTTQRSTRCALVDLRTCGRVNIMAGRSQPRF